MTADINYFYAAFALYLVSGAMYFINFAVRREAQGRVPAAAGHRTAAVPPARPSRVVAAAVSAALTGLIVHCVSLGMRWVVTGHAPLSNMFESLSFFSMCIVAALLLIEKKFQTRALGVVVMPVVFGLMAFAFGVIPDALNKDLVPALKSYWLTLHVACSFVGEAAFAVAFGSSVMYLAAESLEKRGRGAALIERMPDLKALDEISYVSIAAGMPVFTLGVLIFGAIWAYEAWGTYWSWDPKEVWALITWFIYFAYLHARLVMRWKGRTTAWISTIGFLAMMFTYFGVNYVLSGLHSYAK